MRNHRNRTPTQPGRVLITPESGAAFYGTITRADNPTDEGCPVDKVTLDELLAASGTTAGTSDALTLAQDGFALTDGAAVRFKLHVDMNKNATLNVNSTGAKKILNALNKPVKAKSGSWLTVVYNSTTGNFTLQGDGGSASQYGNDPGQISTYQWIQYKTKIYL